MEMAQSTQQQARLKNAIIWLHRIQHLTALTFTLQTLSQLRLRLPLYIHNQHRYSMIIRLKSTIPAALYHLKKKFLICVVMVSQAMDQEPVATHTQTLSRIVDQRPLKLVMMATRYPEMDALQLARLKQAMNVQFGVNHVI